MRKADILSIVNFIVGIGAVIWMYFTIAAQASESYEWMKTTGKPHIEDDYKKTTGIVREEIDRSLEPIKKQLDRIETKLEKK